MTDVVVARKINSLLGTLTVDAFTIKLLRQQFRCEMISNECSSFVIDNGSSMIKAGFGGDEAPRAVYEQCSVNYFLIMKSSLFCTIHPTARKNTL